MDVSILEHIEATGIKAQKITFLLMADKQAQRLITLALEPNVTFGVTADEDEWIARFGKRKVNNGVKPDVWWNDFEQLLGSLQRRDITGNAALQEMEGFLIDAPDTVSLKWACRIINRNLRAGFDIKTARKAWGEAAVKKFEVQLAQAYEGEPLEGWWFFQPKLDGNRVVMIDGKAMSRGGKEYKACQHIINEFEKEYGKSFWKEWVVDGEMMGNLGFDKSSGALRRLDSKGSKAEFTYWVFDLVKREQWDARYSEVLVTRESQIKKVIGTKFKNIKVVPTKELYNPTHKQIMELMDAYIKDGFEGAMAKDVNAQYKWGRGSNVLKVKKFHDGDFKIVDFYEGKGKHKGRLGGIIVENKKSRSKVGSGFDDAMREEIWNNKKKWMGAVVQVQFQEETPDGSLRFPVFIMRRKDKE